MAPLGEAAACELEHSVLLGDEPSALDVDVALVPGGEGNFVGCVDSVIGNGLERGNDSAVGHLVADYALYLIEADDGAALVDSSIVEESCEGA